MGETSRILQRFLFECPEIDIIITPNGDGVMTNNPRITDITKDIVTGSYPKVVKTNSDKGRLEKFVLDSYYYSTYIGMSTIQVGSFTTSSQ